MKTPPTSTRESMILSDAIDRAQMKKAAIAEHLGVTPSLVSQWASGHRPVPADKATKLGRLIGVEPQSISTAYREVSASAEDGNLAPAANEAADDRDMGLAISRLENDVHALNLAVGTLAAVMVTHRPAEAADAASALRRRIPANFREKGFLRELIELLEKAGKR